MSTNRDAQKNVNDLCTAALSAFADDASVPDWAKTLLNLFQGLVIELQEINQLQKKVDSLSSNLKKQEGVNELLLSENDTLRNKVERLTTQVDDQEQKGRNYNLIIHQFDISFHHYGFTRSEVW